MRLSRRGLLVAATASAAVPARAQRPRIRIGVLNDQSGTYRDVTGITSVAVARMKRMPTDDDAFGAGSIREDGRGVFPAYLFQVKSKAESTGPWDLYKLLATTPAAQAIRPLAEGGCKFIAKT